VPAFLTTAPLCFFGTLDGLSLPEVLEVAASFAAHTRVELLYAGGAVSALTFDDGAVVHARFGALRGLPAALAALAQRPVGFTARAAPSRASMSAWPLDSLLAHASALTEAELANLGRRAEAWARAMPGEMRRARLLPSDDEDIPPSPRPEALAARSHPWRAARWSRRRS